MTAMKKLIFLITLIPHFLFAQFDNIEEPKKLGGTVNTSAEENFPIFLKSDGSLYFTRTFNDNSKYGPNDQNVWKSEKVGEQTYQKGTEVKKINNKYNNCIVGFNSDETKIYLLNSYDGKKDLKKGICYSIKKGDSWSKPKSIEIPGLDIEGSFYSFHINKEENSIIISYLGPKSEGDEDLYVCLLENGKWSAPKSMGEAINSKGFEISPFLSQNSDTLFFSSNGFGGEGDADIFYAIRQNNNWFDWSEPINIGSKINSPKFDAYFTMSDRALYWSSNRDAEKSDIYYATFLPPPPPLIASIKGFDVTIHGGSDGKIELTPTGGVKPYTFKWSNETTNEDPENLVKGIYSVEITDAIGQKLILSTPINEPEIIEQIVVVEKIPREDAIVYFDLNSSYLNNGNFKELDLFSSKINDKSSISLKVISHCDVRESDEYNIWLSKKRMNTTINYLVKKGFDRSKISGDYKGEKTPLIKCSPCSEEQFRINRRTTITILN
jgi:outer membrane protein OmpA-like peptidoglycan-associated protein